MKICATFHFIFSVFIFCHFQVNLFLGQSLVTFLLLFLVCSYLDCMWSSDLFLFCFHSLISFKNVFINHCSAFTIMNAIMKKTIQTLLTPLYCKFMLFFILFPVKIVCFHALTHSLLDKLYWFNCCFISSQNFTALNP